MNKHKHYKQKTIKTTYAICWSKSYRSLYAPTITVNGSIERH